MILTQTYIDSKDLRLFIICNSAGSNWFAKRAFYKLKVKILQQYGVHSGYDLQIIEDECWSCNGKGIFRNRELCTSCDKGIFQTRKIALKRYILNDKIFHEPIGHVLPNGNILPFNSLEQIEAIKEGIFYVKEIKGIINHDKGNETLNPYYCYLLLLRKYDKDKFLSEVNYFLNTCSNYTKKKLKALLKKFGTLEGLAKFFAVKEKRLITIDLELGESLSPPFQGGD